MADPTVPITTDDLDRWQEELGGKAAKAYGLSPADLSLPSIGSLALSVSGAYAAEINAGLRAMSRKLSMELLWDRPKFVYGDVIESSMTDERAMVIHANPRGELDGSVGSAIMLTGPKAGEKTSWGSRYWRKIADT